MLRAKPMDLRVSIDKGLDVVKRTLAEDVSLAIKPFSVAPEKYGPPYMTPLEYAERHGKKEIVEYLRPIAEKVAEEDARHKAYAAWYIKQFPNSSRTPGMKGGFSPSVMGAFMNNGARLIPAATYVGYKMFKNGRSKPARKTRKGSKKARRTRRTR